MPRWARFVLFRTQLPEGSTAIRHSQNKVTDTLEVTVAKICDENVNLMSCCAVPVKVWHAVPAFSQARPGNSRTGPPEDPLKTKRKRRNRKRKRNRKRRKRKMRMNPLRTHTQGVYEVHVPKRQHHLRSNQSSHECVAWTASCSRAHQILRTDGWVKVLV